VAIGSLIAPPFNPTSIISLESVHLLLVGMLRVCIYVSRPYSQKGLMLRVHDSVLIQLELEAFAFWSFNYFCAHTPTTMYIFVPMPFYTRFSHKACLAVGKRESEKNLWTLTCQVWSIFRAFAFEIWHTTV